MPRILALLIALSLATSACASNAEQGAERPAATAQEERLHFAAPEGWFTLEGDEPKAGWQVAWASNVPFAAEDKVQSETWLLPSETARNLPPDGIVMVAIGPRVYTGGEEMEHLEFPLKLSDSVLLIGQYETQVAPTVALALLNTWVGDKLLTVEAWLGSNPPSDEMKTEVDRILATLVVPGN